MNAPARIRSLLAGISAPLVLAMTLDAVQIALFPVFAPGFVSVADDVVDAIAFAVFWRWIGWHPALLPGFIFKLVPFVDLAPTWTLAVWIAMRAKRKQGLAGPRPELPR